MYQTSSPSPRKQKHLNLFWVTFAAFVIAGIFVPILASNSVGFSILSAFAAIAFSIGTYRLPQVIDSHKNNLRTLRTYCSIGSVVILVCLLGIIGVSIVKTSRTYYFEHTRSIELVFYAVYLATSVIISKRFHNDERRIQRIKEKPQSQASTVQQA